MHIASELVCNVYTWSGMYVPLVSQNGYLTKQVREKEYEEKKIGTDGKLCLYLRHCDIREKNAWTYYGGWSVHELKRMRIEKK